MGNLDEKLAKLTADFLDAVEPSDREQMARVLDAFTQGVLLGYQMGMKGGDKDAKN